MKRMVLTLMLIHLVAILAAEEDDASHRFTIEGQYIAVEKTANEREIRDNHLDLSNIKVVVSRRKSSENGEIDANTLASGSFDEGQVSLEFDVNQFTEARISILDGENEILSTEVWIEPDGEKISFALLDRIANDSDELLLVGTYRNVKNQDKEFSVSGIYDLTDGEKAPGYLSAALTSFDYLENGTPVQIEFAEVLLEDGRYLIEAEVDEPRACNLRVYRGAEFVWSTALVIEPKAKIEIARHEHGPSNWLIATAETGRHDKLIDSWHMDKEFLSKGSEMVSAPIQERHARFEKVWEVRTNALKKLAWTSEDPFDSLVALELTGTFFGGDMGLINGRDKVKLYDKLSVQLDEDVVARRVKPLRDILVANIARAENLENLSVGAKAPNIVLDNVNGEKTDLSKILSEANMVLVEFWASWCAPCIAKFPTLKNLYAEYQDAGFEVLTVSLDTNGDDWKRSSEKHKLPWYDVGDEKGFYGLSAVDFGVEGVSTNYLLDGEGLIVEKNIDLEQLERLLEAQLSTTSESN